jgi:hypothetical protein
MNPIATSLWSCIYSVLFYYEGLTNDQDSQNCRPNAISHRLMESTIRRLLMGGDGTARTGLQAGDSLMTSRPRTLRKLVSTGCV